MNKSIVRKALSLTICLAMLMSTATLTAFANPKNDHPTPPDPKAKVKSDVYYNNQDNYFTGKGTSKTLKLIKGFETYIQNQGYTCGNCAAMMVENYFTKCGMNEEKVAELQEAMGTNPDYGTDIADMKAYFDNLGWSTEVNYLGTPGGFKADGNAPGEYYNPKIDGYTDDWQSDPYEALRFLKENVDKGIPTMVEWIDWGGHWQVVIGYDQCGTNGWTKEDIRDDVIIMADPGDKTDHNWDGYYEVSAARFCYMWYDDYCMARNHDAHGWNTDLYWSVYLFKPFLVALPPDFNEKTGSVTEK